MRKLIVFIAALTAATAGQAQLPGLRKRTGPPPAEAVAQGIDAQARAAGASPKLRANF